MNTELDVANNTEMRDNEQAQRILTMIKTLIDSNQDGQIRCPIGVGRSMVLTLAGNQLVDIGLNVVYASPMQAMVDQMREFGPNFHAMTYRDFAHRDKTEIPCDVVLYDDVMNVSFDENVLAIRL